MLLTVVHAFFTEVRRAGEGLSLGLRSRFGSNSVGAGAIGLNLEPLVASMDILAPTIPTEHL